MIVFQKNRKLQIIVYSKIFIQRTKFQMVKFVDSLELPYVFVCGLEEGILPHERSMATPEGIEEERRLCYVAVTRAAERLYVPWCRERSASNRNKKSSVSSTKSAKRSRFYDDIEAYGRELASRRNQ